MADVEHGRTLEVPEHLKNVHVKSVGQDAKKADAYKYPHNHAGHHVGQEYFPCLNRYYHPSDQGYELTIRERMQRWQPAANVGPESSGTAPPKKGTA